MRVVVAAAALTAMVLSSMIPGKPGVGWFLGEI